LRVKDWSADFSAATGACATYIDCASPSNDSNEWTLTLSSRFSSRQHRSTPSFALPTDGLISTRREDKQFRKTSANLKIGAIFAETAWHPSHHGQHWH
jgi:hypothetical protein